MPQILRRVVAVAVLLGAWALVGGDRAPYPVTIGQAMAGPAPRWAPDKVAPGAPSNGHELSALRVFTKVILYVKENYVDPKRVRPREMLVSALDYVEKAVPDVMVDGSAEEGKLTLNVNGQVKAFDIQSVDSMWKMNFTLKDMFDFIGTHMRPMEDTRDVEYAAVNGMLSTLDPHSVLLRPEMYREMKLTTKGEFGGLGFVIQMREGNLTVVKVLPKTPAHRAGIKKDDQIRKIGEESTVNMDLNEAVSKLRGPVDSKVTITLHRRDWEKPTAMTLTRALINIESVQSKLLAQNVGYVRLKNFQGNTTRHLQEALQTLSTQAGGSLKGLVLDLRGNPGGLLEQAISVSDQFLSQGTIVATVGLSDKLREEKRARADDGDNAYPIAVLVNAGSASASEIVAGALKNLNRAVIIGRQTFGKGSVQVLYDFPDDSALKLTIAKYLTPGDISIQEVGIVPDIELLPTRVTAERLDVFAPRKIMGEADLDRHFGNPNNETAVSRREDIVTTEKPLELLKYLKEEPRKAPVAAAPTGKKPAPTPQPQLDSNAPPDELDDQLDAEAQDEIKEDFEITFARDYVLKAPFLNRKKMLEAGRAFVQQKRNEEQQRISTAISALGIDWSEGATPKTVQLAASLKPGPQSRIQAGESIQLELAVENKGAEPIKRLRAWTESANGFLDRREFVFGALAPGARKTWTVPIKLSKDLATRLDDVTVKFFDDQGALPHTLVGELAFNELPRPSFAFSHQVIDNCPACSGDGTIQRGEELVLLVDVTNVGAGKALDAFAQIKNTGGENIFIEKGRFKLGELAPGETRTARFELTVKKGFAEKDVPLKLAIIDEPLEEFLSENLQIPVREQSLVMENRKSWVKVSDKALLLPSADPQSTAFARVAKTGSLQVLGGFGPTLKVALEGERFAFVSNTEVKETRSRTPAPPLSYLPQRRPPQISLGTDSNPGSTNVDTERFKLTGTVTNPNGNLDVFVLVNDQKVFFKSAGEKEPNLTFSSEFSLKEGNNPVVIVARENQEFASRKLLLVRRRPAKVAQKTSPRPRGAP